MKNLDNDMKIWMENQKVENLFKKIGFELLKDTSLEFQMVKEYLSSKQEACFLYLELFNKIFESSTFLVKDIKGTLYGYKDDGVITYMGEDLLDIQKSMSLSEDILINHCYKENQKYENLQKQFNIHGLDIRDYAVIKSIYENDDESIDLYDELSNVEDVCKYGRVLKVKEWNIKDKEFLEWRKPRFGNRNPTKVISKVWEYAVHTRKNAYLLGEKFNAPSSFNEGAGWCFERFGKSVTFMPDGRELHIAGEHEDGYDPDFYIYNDVVVVYPDESIEFYNYPKNEFPSTDFHSATLVDDTIVMIGNLGYGKSRQIGQTQILLLDTKSYKIKKIEPAGLQIGWIHGHKATLSEDKKSIKVVGGKLDLGSDISLVENIDEWELDLSTWCWKQLTKKLWRQFEFRKKDKTSNNLFWIRNALFSLEANWEDTYKNDLESLTEYVGFTPNVTLVKELYLPNIEHEVVTMNRIENTYIITVEGIRVRFNESSYSIILTIEGNLKDEYIENIKKSLLNKLTVLEGCEYTFTEISRNQEG